MNKLKKVLLLGSGALKIGEAGEFDYSGSQALKALKEEGISSVLINPNIATIQTSPHMADAIYFLPVTPYFVEQVIKKEKPDGILLGFGGQTALNCGLALEKKGVFKKYKVTVLGTPVSVIRDTEDRELFKRRLAQFGLLTPKSSTASTVSQATKAASRLEYPVIIRSGFALGGQGSGIARNEKELVALAQKAFVRTSQILVEECLVGWKEIEYEVVRDQNDNCITVCNMENLDPMGIHTGESIVVAPSQTLTNSDYFKLRQVSLDCIRGLGIIGECNIQFAFSPQDSSYRIIEVNARLSRSSALASKATGYPLAFIAAKLSLGYTLPELKNSVTKTTSAFFEPALDYIVVKLPRWDLKKLKYAQTTIGTEMKSVGEVMAIGRSFGEALQKACRMISQGHQGILDEKLLDESKNHLLKRLDEVTPERLFILVASLFNGLSVEEAYKLTKIDRWFLHQLVQLVRLYKKLIEEKKLDKIFLTTLKQQGFSDFQIGTAVGKEEKTIRLLRKKENIIPMVNQIDTLAGEFPAQTNYLYMTYHGIKDDVVVARRNHIAVLGGGPYHIGSSVEFDWCAVTTAKKLREMGYQTTMINCNPETVSTDYDISDSLFFEELTFERVMDIWEKKMLSGMILSVGGQIPNNLATLLADSGVTVLGTDPRDIDRAENRHTFSNLLDTLGIKQPLWKEFRDKNEIFKFAQTVGYPILIRPSYVLSGTAMVVSYTKEDIEDFLLRREAAWGYPVVVSKFLEGAAEFDFDGVSQKGTIIVSTLSEHVEEGGVHSGDATLILPAQTAHLETVEKIKEISSEIAKALRINGPFNIQFLAKEGEVYVIECNVRASRSFPFCSKVMHVNMIEMATEVLMGKKPKQTFTNTLLPNRTLPYIGVKTPQFSFSRLAGADPILRVEMASTGEVGCLGPTLEDAFLKSFLAVGNRLPQKNILLTIGGEAQKHAFSDAVRTLHELGYRLYGTEGTAQFYSSYDIPIKRLFKGYEGQKPGVLEYLRAQKIDMVIILSDKPDLSEKRKEFTMELTDGYRMRRIASDLNIPIITNIQLARLFIRSIAKIRSKDELQIEPWNLLKTYEK